MLFDLNRSASFGPLLRAGRGRQARAICCRPGPRPYRTRRRDQREPGLDREVVERRASRPGETDEHSRALGLSFPLGVFSLSHVALPFPIDDPLYGLTPDPAEDFGIRLGADRGARRARGARASLDSLLRLSSNPFAAYQMARIESALGPR